ncbi:MAG: HAD-IA family hydrolase [Ignavibacteriaceae bacterium]
MSNLSTIKHISFDLDGTITDSVDTIYMSTIKTLEKLKIPNNLTPDEFRNRVGYHFQDIFNDLNIPVNNFEEYLAIYKDFYLMFINKSRIYDGVSETLQYLKDQDISLSLCTTKVQSQADMVIDYFGLRKYFSLILGRRDNLKNKPSAEPLLFICSELNVNPGASLLVGDTELDIRCGKNAGAKTCAASYGYRDLNIIREEHPDYIINDIKGLINLVVQSRN